MTAGTAGSSSTDRSPASTAATAGSARPRLAALARVWVPLLGLWAVLATGLSILTTKIVNWYLMTDELFYERLAISVLEHRSPLPRIHGELLPNVNQLYPLLLAPAFRHDLIVDALRDAHVVNAWLMTSACIPAFLLARRVTGRLWASYGVAVLTMVVPWIVYSGFLLTEVAGYPAFVWGVYAIHRTTAAPSRGNDWLALGGIALAMSARMQFVVLLAVAPLAIYAHALAYAEGGRLHHRLGTAAREAVRSHRVLAVACAVLVAAVVVLLAADRLASALGTYASTASADMLHGGILEALAEHTAALALGLGLVPFLVGVAWLLTRLVRPESRETHAFACVAVLAIVATLVEVSLFDLRYGGPDWVRDRYLFFVAPLVLVGFAGALCGTRWPRWSILWPAALVTAGFLTGRLPTFYSLSLDMPVAVVYERVIAWAGSYDAARWLLVVATVVLTVLYLQASVLLRHGQLAAVLAVVALATLPAGTASALVRMFRPDDESVRRQLTHDRSSEFAWIDLTADPGAEVTMIPYPSKPGNYWMNVGDWWTLEFWNRSIVGSAHSRGEFEWTPSTFAKLYLRFDPRTGLANDSPTPLVAQSDKDARFRISGEVRALPSDVMLVEAEQPWRTDWLSYGLYADGWTRPGVEARVRVFPFPGQQGAVTRMLYLSVLAPSDLKRRPFEAVSSIDAWHGVARGDQKVGRVVDVCVPEDGFSEVRISTPESSTISFGDMRDVTQIGVYRETGVLLAQIALADEHGGPCTPGAGPR